MLEGMLQEIRSFTYTVLCFQCLTRLFGGSSYEKYLQLFQYLLILMMGIHILFHIMDAFGQEFVQFEDWYMQWSIRCKEFEEQIYDAVD